LGEPGKYEERLKNLIQKSSVNEHVESPHSDGPGNRSKALNASILILPFLTLVTPFLVFLENYSYGLFHVEILISIIGILLVSLLCSAGMRYGGFIGESILGFTLVTFFLSIQFGSSGEIVFTFMLVGVALLLLIFKDNFPLIAASIFATFFIVTLAQAFVPKGMAMLEFERQSGATERVPFPRLIHIVLDEHIGLEGIPTDLPEGVMVKKQLRDFYEKYGFATFGGAYSHYFHTVNALPNLLNFSSSSTARMYLGKEDNPNRLLQNVYFERLSEAGYRLNVWWGHHVDYCSHSLVPIENCIQVPAEGLKISRRLPLNTVERLQLVFSAYLNLSKIYQRGRDYYQSFRNEIIPYGVSLPSANWDRHMVTALPYLTTLDDLWENILDLPEGNAVFAHVLIPHYPYVADADCTIKGSINKWKYSSLLFTPHHPYREGLHNTKDSRKTHYQEYFKQVQCIYIKLEELFEKMDHAGIFENTVIAIQGDHGSRIVKREPTIENEHELSREDIVDAYSTLFAVKFPKQIGYYDTQPFPIEFLLQEKVANTLIRKNGNRSPSDPFVFLRSEDQKILDLKPFPYPIAR
jgi:hypothetical protein